MQAKTHHLPLLRRLAQDRSGNTLALIAASLLPILAMVGGGVDMGRSYLSNARLQQACDAGVLAARKKLGSAVVVTGEVPAGAADVGVKFFNLNFRDGAYGTRDRDFQMTLEDDYSISGTATVAVPVTVMGVFGFSQVDLKVDCQAKLNFSNTDVMMVLDTTGSMAWTNPSDAVPRIDVLRSVVKTFHGQLEGAKKPGTRMRYGFVPYSTNVNVGFQLKSDWVVDDWEYHGRENKDTGATRKYDVYDNQYTYISGSSTAITSYTAATCPASTATWTSLSSSTDADGTQRGRNLVHGTSFSCNIGSDGTNLIISGTVYDNYVYDWSSKKTGEEIRPVYNWFYKKMPFDVTFVKGATGSDPLVAGSIDVLMDGYPSPTPLNLAAWFRGCIEERDTYEIDDYSNVDFSRALDLDLDLVPTPGNPATQWRPMINELSFEPEVWWDGTGTFKTPSNSENHYLMAQWGGFSACPSPAHKLDEMTPTEVSDYVDSLVPAGSTYHDIGMIWGGRFLSPTGIFADENADLPGKPTSRHLIFLTDGETAPLDISYGTYGIEPLDERRWSQKSAETLTEVVEQRFGVACNEVKKRNITVWVIGFGTSLNPIMTECAGPGHFFEAADSAQLNSVFSKIAASIGELRISK
jgi:Putative Flp pilus-assembly TadE/G-like